MDWVQAALATGLLVLTGALVYLTKRLADATRAYTDHTGNMVVEMRIARESEEAARVAAIKPRLTLTMEHPTQKMGRFVLQSSGAAAAFNINVDIDYGPGVATVHWYSPLMTTGTQQRFMAPNKELDMEKLAKLYRRVRVIGTFQDVERTPYDIDEIFELRHYWESNAEANWHHRVSRFTRLMRAVEKLAGVDPSPVEP